MSQSVTIGSGTKGSGPVGYWNFDEAGGPTVYDKSGNNNNGALNAGASGSNTAAGHMWDAEGKFGGCLEFDGTDDYVNLGSGANIDLSNTNFTFEVWVKPAGSGERAIFRQDWSDTGRYTYARVNSSGYIDFWATPLATTGWTVSTSGTSLNDGNWHHIAMTVVRGGSAIVYIDGVNTASDPTAGSGDLGTISSSWIGRDTSGGNFHGFNGLIDEVKIYNRALSPDEILMEYNAGSAAHIGGSPSFYDPWGGNPPIAWLSFDENTGTTAYDRSGNGNDGTITDATWAHGKYGPALSFDGSGDYVDCGTALGVSLNGVSGLTFEGWFKLDVVDGDDGLFAIRLTGDGDWFWNIRPGGANFWVGYKTSAGASYRQIGNPFSGEAGNWIHLATTYTSGHLRTYKNGIEIDDFTTPTGTVAISTNAVTYIGIYATPAGYATDGLIDEVKIYDYARTQAQIAWDYNQGKPVALWRMDEATSGSAVGSSNIKDSSDNGNHGSGSGSNIAWTTGRFGGALSFNGTDDYVNITDPGSNWVLDIEEAITLAAWVKPNGLPTSGEYQILEKPWTSHVAPYYLYNFGVTPAGAIRFDIATDDGGPSGGLTSCIKGSTITGGVWAHVAATYDGSDMRIYIDGVDVGSTPKTGKITIANTALKIGRRGNLTSDKFKGTIDDVRIYNYARTAEQIKQDYNEGAAAHFGE